MRSILQIHPKKGKLVKWTEVRPKPQTWTEMDHDDHTMTWCHDSNPDSLRSDLAKVGPMVAI